MNRKINLAQLTELFAKTSGLPKNVSAVFVRSFFETIAKKVIDEDQVKVKGLGTFKRTDISDRESINVNTGERFVIPGHVKISFNPDADLKEFINKPFACFETILLDVDTPEVQTESVAATDSGQVTEETAEQEPVHVEKQKTATDSEPETVAEDKSVIGQDESEPITETNSVIVSETGSEAAFGEDSTMGSEATIVSEHGLKDELEPVAFMDSGHEIEEEPVIEPKPVTDTEYVTVSETRPDVEDGNGSTIESESESESAVESEQGLKDDELESDALTDSEHDLGEEPERESEPGAISTNQNNRKGSKGHGLRVMMYVLGLLLLLLLVTYCIWPLNLLHIMRDEMRRLEVDDGENGAVSVEQVDIVRKNDGNAVTSSTKTTDTPAVHETEQSKPSTDRNDIHKTDDNNSNKKTDESSPTTNSQPEVIKPIDTQPAVQNQTETRPVEEPIVTEPLVTTSETANEQNAYMGLRLTPADEAKELADFTFADTTSYRMAGTKAVHMLSSGETLTRISQQYYGTKKLWPYIAAYNHLSNTNNVKAGYLLDIPVLVNK